MSGDKLRTGLKWLSLCIVAMGLKCACYVNDVEANYF